MASQKSRGKRGMPTKTSPTVQRKQQQQPKLQMQVKVTKSFQLETFPSLPFNHHGHESCWHAVHPTWRRNTWKNREEALSNPDVWTNLLQLHKQLNGVTKQSSKFQRTRNGTRDITKNVIDFSAAKDQCKNNNLSYFIFFSKSGNSIKIVIRYQQPSRGHIIWANRLCFDDITVTQMSTNRRSAGEGTNLLPTLPNNDKGCKITGNFQTGKPMPHFNQGRGL